MRSIYLITIATFVVAWIPDPLLAQAPKTSAPVVPLVPWSQYNEGILTHYQVATDTSSLLDYLRRHSSNDDDLLAIPELINELGNKTFTRRKDASKKLLALGLPIYALLRDALTNPDPEIARMAKFTMERMDRTTGTVAVPPCVVRLLLKRQPPATLEVLLRYLPYTTDPQVEEQIYYGIDSLAFSNGQIQSVVVNALRDKVPARRAIAGCIIARAGTAEQKQSARLLLADPDQIVRLRTAQGFLAGGSATGIPALIDLLEAKPVPVAWQAEELLAWSAGDNAPKEVVWAGKERAKAAKEAWKNWWRNGNVKLELQTRQATTKPQLFWPLKRDGRAEYGAMLIGGNGQTRWKLKVTAGDLVGKARLRHYICRPDGKVYGLREIPSTLDRPFETWVVDELTLEGKLLSTLDLNVERVHLSDEVFEIAPNGVLTTSGITPGGVGLEGTAFSPTLPEGKDHSPDKGLKWSRRFNGYCDHLACAHVYRRAQNLVVNDEVERFEGEELRLLDLREGRYVIRLPLKELAWQNKLPAYLTCLPDRLFIKGENSIWMFEKGGVQKEICKLDFVTPKERHRDRLVTMTSSDRIVAFDLFGRNDLPIEDEDREFRIQDIGSQRKIRFRANYKEAIGEVDEVQSLSSLLAFGFP